MESGMPPRSSVVRGDRCSGIHRFAAHAGDAASRVPPERRTPRLKADHHPGETAFRLLDHSLFFCKVVWTDFTQILGTIETIEIEDPIEVIDLVLQCPGK